MFWLSRGVPAAIPDTGKGIGEINIRFRLTMGKYYGRQGIGPDNGQYSDEESGGYHGGSYPHDSSSRDLDRLLPIANVGRIMKRALPVNAKISKEAKETVQECVSEFISFITGEASDKCQKEKRKTVNGDDLLWAINTLGFEDYIEPLKVYLGKYREMEKSSMTRQGDQVVLKEGSSLGVSSADYGVGGSLAGGAGSGSYGIPGQSYGQKPPALMHSQHQLPTAYKMLYSRSGGMNGTHLQ